MSALYIYNSLTKQKELFTPITSNQIKMYVCGMTVYDYCHIGHARVMLVFDIIAAWLRVNNYKVTYVRNITDIDDKIIERAVKNNESISALTNRFIQAMHEDADKLGIKRPDIEPRATDYIKPMLSMVGKLIENNLAYQSKSGDINFKVRNFPGYGKLSGKHIDDLQSGHRATITTLNNIHNKQDNLDFVLWKSAKEHEPIEVKWQSPWGLGRPGWHIECSAMSCEILGEQFDIHGGGIDLQFPHHENEIAQSEGAFYYKNGIHSGKNMANYWIHNGFVKVNDEKMSKSLGNFFTIREVFEYFHPEVIRFFILKVHYRSPLNYADIYLQEAKTGLERIYNVLANFDLQDNECTQIDWNNHFAQKFFLAMNDDFNTAIAISVLFELVSYLNKHKDEDINTNINIKTNLELAYLLRNLCNIIGIVKLKNADELNIKTNKINQDLIYEKIEQRKIAKLEKRYADADEIRNELIAMGVSLQDTPQGETTWKIV